MPKAEYTQRALDIIKERRRMAGINQEIRLGEVQNKIPHIRELRRKLANTSAQLIKTIISHPKNADAFIENIKNENTAIQKQIKQLLEEQNYPEDYLSVQYTCSVCKDTGFVLNKKCICLESLIKEIATKALTDASGLQLHSFDNFLLEYYPQAPMPNLNIIPREIMTRIYQYCKHYAESFTRKSNSLFIKGNTGLGKTHLSLAIAKVVIDKGYHVVYGTAGEFLRKISSENFDRNQNSSETLDLIMQCDLLIMDDLGSEFDSSFNNTTIYNIINTRSSKGMPTIINTNLKANELEEKYSPRILSRLYTYQSLNFVGIDIRQLKATKK